MSYFKADRRTKEISREAFMETMSTTLAEHSGTPWKASKPRTSQSSEGPYFTLISHRLNAI